MWNINLVCFFSTKTMGIINIHFGHCVGKYGPGTVVLVWTRCSSALCLFYILCQFQCAHFYFFILHYNTFLICASIFFRTPSSTLWCMTLSKRLCWQIKGRLGWDLNTRHIQYLKLTKVCISLKHLWKDLLKSFR